MHFCPPPAIKSAVRMWADWRSSQTCGLAVFFFLIIIAISVSIINSMSKSSLAFMLSYQIVAIFARKTKFFFLKQPLYKGWL